MRKFQRHHGNVQNFTRDARSQSMPAIEATTQSDADNLSTDSVTIPIAATHNTVSRRTKKPAAWHHATPPVSFHR